MDDKNNNYFKLYVSDAGRLFASPLKWRQREYLYFFVFLIITALCFNFDEAIRGFFLSQHSPIADHIFSVVDVYGKGYIQILCFLFLVPLGLKYDRKLLGFSHLLFESIVFSGIVTNILKMTFGRWRPFTGHGNLSFTPFVFLSKTGQVSLPSADVSLAFSCSLIMAELFESKLWKIMWYFFALLTALGRIYHDKHWTSDTVISIFLCFYIAAWLKQQSFSWNYDIKD